MKQKKILREAKKAAKRQAREAANRETVQPTGPREIVLFSAVELLEQILLELDMATLLTVAQRVHSHWRKVINTSSAIQQHLFFRPISVPTSSCPSPVQNPLLESHFWPFFRTWAPKPRTAIWQHRDRILPLSFRPTGELSAEILWRALPNFSDMSNSKRRQVALTRADASWRRMLVSQPPPRRIGRMKEWGRLVSTGTQRQRLETVWDRKFVDVPDGLKMGELYDIIDAAIWRRFPGPERHKSLKRCYTSGLWIGWKVGTDDEVERLGINPSGRTWFRASGDGYEMPQPWSSKTDRWVEEEGIDMVIGEKCADRLQQGRCRGHGNHIGPLPAPRYQHRDLECCDWYVGLPKLPGVDRAWCNLHPRTYNEDSARWMFACEGRNEELVEKLAMGEVGEPTGRYATQKLRYY